jgi:Cellulase (glycosyl hydrolase family 5)
MTATTRIGRRPPPSRGGWCSWLQLLCCYCYCCCHWSVLVVDAVADAVAPSTRADNNNDDDDPQPDHHHHSGRDHHAVDTDDDNVDTENGDSIVFAHFVAHNATMTCTADEHTRPFNKQIRGVNLGGWLVLEPWITPSLFYQFLGKGENTTAYDMYTFCQVLGPVEANKQLRRHWEAWVTEDILDELHQSGAGINTLRLPVGDFQFIPYGAYDNGCTDGSLDYIEQLLDWALERGISVLFDVHTMKDSQNGFDNSVRCFFLFRRRSTRRVSPISLLLSRTWGFRKCIYV